MAENVSTDSVVIWLFFSSSRSNADECAKKSSGIDLIELLCNKSTRNLVNPRTNFGGSFLIELKVRSMLVKSLFSVNKPSRQLCKLEGLGDLTMRFRKSQTIFLEIDFLEFFIALECLRVDFFKATSIQF